MTRRVAEDALLGRHVMRYSLTGSRGTRICWSTSSELGQFPPRRMDRLVARSFESSSGKIGTLAGLLGAS
ncbi:hypothetical protein V2G26_008296 [Clonostachys chloroleuca]